MLLIAKTIFACAALGALVGCSTAGSTSSTTLYATQSYGYPQVTKEKWNEPIRRGRIAREPRQSKPVYLGRAPYICTPSGFGQTSSCFLRNS